MRFGEASGALFINSRSDLQGDEPVNHVSV